MYQGKKRYCQILWSEYERRRAKNSKYSLRSFAKFLNIHSSSLCSVFHGKRNLPLKRGQEFCQKLGMNEESKVEFLRSLEQEHFTLGSFAQRVGGKSNKGERLVYQIDAEKLELAQRLVSEFKSKMSEFLSRDEGQGQNFVKFNVNLDEVALQSEAQGLPEKAYLS